MPPTIEEEEVPLEIEDFGCETPFERTSAAVEEFLRGAVAALWPTTAAGGGGNAAANNKAWQKGNLKRRKRNGLVASKEFSTGREDAIEVSLYHDAQSHPIARWMGVATFAIVSGRHTTSPSRSDSALYLSYLIVACDQLELPLPCFTPTGDTHSDTFMGCARNPPLVARYSLEAFPRGVPPQCRGLAGLVDLLQLNVGLQSRVVADPSTGAAILVDHERAYRIATATTPIADPTAASAGALIIGGGAKAKTATVSSSPSLSIGSNGPLFLDERHVWVDALKAMNEAALERCGLATVPFGPTACPLLEVAAVCRWFAVDERRLHDSETRSDFDVTAKGFVGPDGGASNGPHPTSRACAPALRCRLENAYGLTFHAADAVSSAVFLLVTHLRAVAVANGANYNVPEGEESDGYGAERDAAYAKNQRALDAEPRATNELFKCLVAEVLNTDPIPPLPVTRRCLLSFWGAAWLPGDEQQPTAQTAAAPPSASVAGPDPRLSYIPNSFLNRCAFYSAKALLHPDDAFILWLEAVEGLRRAVCAYLESPRPNFEATMRGVLGVGLAGDEATVPDLDAPLIVQKLQMLHYCLVRHERDVTAGRRHAQQGRGKEYGEGASPRGMLSDGGSGEEGERGRPDGWDGDDAIDFESCTDGSSEADGNAAANEVKKAGGGGWDDDDDELDFGDNDEKKSDGQLESSDEDEEAGKEEDSGAEKKSLASCASSEGLGAFEPLADGDGLVSGHFTAPTRRLLRDGEPMVFPPARAAIPQTRDVIEAEQQTLERLGTAAAGASARLWLQSRTLRDDMIYFRSCQPQGADVDFVDFIRWHSPKDYVGPPFDSAELSVAESDALRREAAAMPTDELLSQRMGGGASLALPANRSDDEGEKGKSSSPSSSAPNMWRVLWEEACAAPPDAAKRLADAAFHAEPEARRVLAWLADSVTTEDVLVHFALATASNALHRMACHPIVLSEASPALVSSANTAAPHSACPLRSFLRRTASEMARCGVTIAHAVAHSALAVHAEVEAVKGLAVVMIRLVRDAEMALTGALSVRRLLCDGRGHGGEAISPFAGAIAMTGLRSMPGAALGEEEEEGHSSRGDEGAVTDDVAVPADGLWAAVVPLIPSAARPMESRYALECAAERPMNAEPSLQRLLVATDRHDTCRVALCLSEEIY